MKFEKKKTWKVSALLAFTVLVVLVVSFGIFFNGCAGWNDPIPTTPHPGYPCGYQGISCGHHMCCPLDYTCGPSAGCPSVGACCYEGSHGGGFERPQLTKQTSESP
jgi:hypothetical protein